MLYEIHCCLCILYHLLNEQRRCDPDLSNHPKPKDVNMCCLRESTRPLQRRSFLVHFSYGNGTFLKLFLYCSKNLNYLNIYEVLNFIFLMNSAMFCVFSGI